MIEHLTGYLPASVTACSGITRFCNISSGMKSRPCELKIESMVGPCEVSVTMMPVEKEVYVVPTYITKQFSSDIEI